MRIDARKDDFIYFHDQRNKFTSFENYQSKLKKNSANKILYSLCAHIFKTIVFEITATALRLFHVETFLCARMCL